MHRHTGSYLKLAATALLVTATFAPAHAQSAKPDVPAGFTALFDGKTLNGWRGDTTIWSVRDGAITGGSDQPVPTNTFLISDKPYGDFEVRFKYRWLTDQGNSGFQFRSGPMEGHYALSGLQANVTPLGVPPERFGMLYNESGDRQEMGLLGQRAEITRRTATGGGTARVVRTVKEMVNSREDILASVRTNPEWNEVVLIAYGNRLVSAINGLLAFDVTDNDPVQQRDGLFGLQAHSGPPMWVQYKDIVIKPLKSAPTIEGRFKTKPTAAPAPTQTYKDSTRAGLKDVALPQ